VGEATALLPALGTLVSLGVGVEEAEDSAQSSALPDDQESPLTPRRAQVGIMIPPERTELSISAFKLFHVLEIGRHGFEPHIPNRIEIRTL